MCSSLRRARRCRAKTDTPHPPVAAPGHRPGPNGLATNGAKPACTARLAPRSGGGPWLGPVPAGCRPHRLRPSGWICNRAPSSGLRARTPDRQNPSTCRATGHRAAAGGSHRSAGVAGTRHPPHAHAGAGQAAKTPSQATKPPALGAVRWVRAKAVSPHASATAPHRRPGPCSLRVRCAVSAVRPFAGRWQSARRPAIRAGRAKNFPRWGLWQRCAKPPVCAGWGLYPGLWRVAMWACLRAVRHRRHEGWPCACPWVPKAAKTNRVSSARSWRWSTTCRSRLCSSALGAMRCCGRAAARPSAAPFQGLRPAAPTSCCHARRSANFARRTAIGPRPSRQCRPTNGLQRCGD